jgi:uncharacterized protein YqgV (UPF0045/DUF77 family)
METGSTLSGVVHIEFTIEPFVEGQPGSHVTAAIDAARMRNVDVDVGPFGSSCDVALDDVGSLVGAVTAEAFANGATHVSVHAEMLAVESPSNSGSEIS